MPESWRDIYEWYAGGIGPNSRSEALAKTAPLSFLEVDKAKEKCTQW